MNSQEQAAVSMKPNRGIFSKLYVFHANNAVNEKLQMKMYIIVDFSFLTISGR